MKMLASFALAAVFLLSACGGETSVEREEGGAGEAEGEVLGGSISDAMLPLDSIQSQSPPLRQASQGDAEGAPADEAGEAEPTPEQAPAEPAEPAAGEAAEG